jgi:hypothetical protein
MSPAGAPLRVALYTTGFVLGGCGLAITLSFLGVFG